MALAECPARTWFPLVTAFLILPVSQARPEGPVEKLPFIPSENKDFPRDKTFFVSFYVTKGMIEKRLDLYAGYSLREKGGIVVGLLDKNGVTLMTQRTTPPDKLFGLGNLGRLRVPGWHFAAFRAPARQIRETRLTTSTKAPLIKQWAIIPDEASTDFTVRYTLNVDGKTTCTATPMEGPNKAIEVQGEITRKQGTEYKVKWDAGKEKPGPYGVRLRATDVNDETLFDQRDDWRQIKKR